MEWIADPQVWIALATLTVLEVVLGIDNIVFIAILAAKVEEKKRKAARRIGLILAMVTRVLLLFSISWIMRLEATLFTVLGEAISGRDLILIGGGLFLLAKSTREIHEQMEHDGGRPKAAGHATFTSVVLQIMVLDIVFSLDSVITAIGLANQLAVMVAAVMIAVVVMLIFVEPISRFVDEHPTIKILALSFLLLIGFTLVGEGIGLHIPKGAIYFAMAFSAFVEMLNLRVHKRRRRKAAEEKGAA